MAVVDLAAYAGQTISVTLRATSAGTFEGDMAIDNIGFVELPVPVCAAPSILTATNITSSGADLSWTAGGTETAWDIEIGIAGFTPTGTPTDAGVTNPYSVTTLSSATNPSRNYDYYVRAVCSATNTSNWTGPFFFQIAATCGDDIYDTGGPILDYGNNESYTVTYLPVTIGDVVTLDFTLVDIQSCCDTLEIFDGLDVTASVLEADLEAPASFTATNPDGAITIRFTSDATITAQGWTAMYSCATAGTEDATFDNEVTLYPNPLTVDSLTINLGNSIVDQPSVVVYNMLGQQVISRDVNNVSNNTFVIDNLSTIETGVYFVHITNGSSTTVKRFIKQ
ncbi:hypothetical protein JCM19297_1042 [Nonlabens ulvanivorans]|nr:hypothetical protein JCM19297_1042 [Nonlabens ulvanivorans]